mgnify:CR=1 FL=1
MFRYGGDVKAKGVMHGMKNMQDGGPATMADATGLANGGMPNMRGRVTGPGGYAGMKDKAISAYNSAKKNPIKTIGSGIGGGYGFEFLSNLLANASAAGLFAKGGLADLPPMRGMVTGPGKYSQNKLVDTTGNILKKTVVDTFKKNPVKVINPTKRFKAATGILSNLYKKLNIQTIPKRIPSSAGMGGVKLTPAQVAQGMGTKPLSYLERINMFRKANPKTFYGGLGLGTTTGVIPYGGAKLAELGGNLGLEIADRAVHDSFGFDQDKVIGGNVREVFGKVKKALGFEDKKVPPPGEGAPGSNENAPYGIKEPRKLTQAEIDAKTKADEDIKLKRIYSLLGVDRAQRGAASKALADMSRYIDEGGKDTISRKNIGSTLTKGILAFDKRLDKVDQLKEAAGLMMAKGEIEKDLYKEKGNAATQAIDALAAASGKSKGFIANAKLGIANTAAEAKSQLASTKNMTVTHDTLVPVIRNYAENSGKEFKKQFTTDQKNQKVGKGKEYATVTDLVQSLDLDKNGSDDGIYVVGISIIEVEKGVAKLTG